MREVYSSVYHMASLRHMHQGIIQMFVAAFFSFSSLAEVRLVEEEVTDFCCSFFFLFLADKDFFAMMINFCTSSETVSIGAPAITPVTAIWAAEDTSRLSSASMFITISKTLLV